MKEIKVGLKFSRESGIAFFGLEEANSIIESGSRVIAVKGGDAIMRKEDSQGEDVKLTLAGFSVILVIADS